MKAEHLAEHQDAIFGRLAKRGRDLDRYAMTIANLLKTDVFSDVDYQRNFNSLFCVLRNAQARTGINLFSFNYPIDLFCHRPTHSPLWRLMSEHSSPM